MSDTLVGLISGGISLLIIAAMWVAAKRTLNHHDDPDN